MKDLGVKIEWATIHKSTVILYIKRDGEYFSRKPLTDPFQPKGKQ